MSFAAANKSKPKNAKTEPPKASKPDTKAPVLGVNLKGELLDVEMKLIIDPAGAADRMPRPGDDEAIEQLAGSMKECGQLQPVMVERLVDGRFCRVFGRRRLAAARRLGWTTIRASVVEPLPDDVRRTVVAIENVQRQDLTPAEETLAVDELMLLQAVPAARQLGKPLMQGCGAWSGVMASAATSFDDLPEKGRAAVKAALSHDALLDPRVRLIASELVAAMLGKQASWVRDRLYIGRLSDKAKQLVLEAKLPLAHAREISKVADPRRRDELVKAYAAGGSDSISDTEAGPLEDLQDEVRKSVFALHVVPWKLEVPFAGKVACEGCPHNSSTNPGLFEGGAEVSMTMVGGRGTYDSTAADGAKVTAAGICTLPSCYAEKLRSAKAAISAAAKRIVDGGKKADVKVPPYVSTSALEAKVNARRKSKKSGSSRPAKIEITPAMKERQEREAAERDVRWKLQDALRNRVRDFEKPLAQWLAKKPGRWGLFKAVTESKLWQATQNGDDKKATKAAGQPGLRRLIELVKEPSLDGLIEIEKTAGRQFGNLTEYNDYRSGIVDILAEAYGIEIDEPPTLEQFMPAKFRAKKEEAKAGAKGKPSKSSGGTVGNTSSTGTGAAESPAGNARSRKSKALRATGVTDAEAAAREASEIEDGEEFGGGEE